MGSIMATTKSLIKDPICGMTVDETSSLHTKRDGKTYYFCSAGCQKKFLSQPASVQQKNDSGGCCG